MLFCDLAVNGTPVWYGMRCESFVAMKHYTYINFIGQLFFIDTQGIDDPDYTGLGSRFVLTYYNTGQDDMVVIPISAIPSQQFDIVLSGQLCTISLYTKP